MWRKVSDELPPKYEPQHVLWDIGSGLELSHAFRIDGEWFEIGTSDEIWWDNGKWNVNWANVAADGSAEATPLAWQPLPEPPEGE